MALAVTVKETHSTSADINTTWSSDAFTPANNSLLVVVFTAQVFGGDGAPHTAPTLAGGSLTWTRQGWVHESDLSAGSAGAIWTAPVTTGASMTVTVTNNDSDDFLSAAMTVYEITGHDTTTPVGATLFTSGLSRSGAYTGTMSGTPAGTSVVIAGAVGDEATLTVGSGWTSDFSFLGDAYMDHLHEHLVGATTVNYAAITTIYSWAVVGIEIKEAPGGIAASGAISGSGSIAAAALKSAFIRPDADDTAGNWTSTAASLYEAIDESVVNDADYIKSPVNPVNEVCKIRLSDPSATPAEPMTIRYQAQKTAALGTMELRVRLLQGTTQIASWTESDVPIDLTDYARTLSSGEFAAITDFNDLFLEFRANLT